LIAALAMAAAADRQAPPPTISARILTAPFVPPFRAIVNRSVSNTAGPHRQAAPLGQRRHDRRHPAHDTRRTVVG
jgi:hypothetical protein